MSSYGGYGGSQSGWSQGGGGGSGSQGGGWKSDGGSSQGGSSSQSGGQWSQGGNSGSWSQGGGGSGGGGGSQQSWSQSGSGSGNSGYSQGAQSQSSSGGWSQGAGYSQQSGGSGYSQQSSGGGGGAGYAQQGGASAQSSTNGSWSQTGSAGGGWQQGGKAGSGAAQGGGMPKTLSITCKNSSMVSQIVSGSFTLNAENHSKPTYKKDQKVSGLEVMLYFWDERDGSEMCGWYVGPEIGGNQVWAFTPGKTSPIPPQTGWQVPYGGPVDPSFSLSYAAQAPPQQQQAAPQQQQQSWGQQQQAKPQQQQSWGQQQQPQQQQQQQQQSWGQQQQQPQQQPQQQQSWGQQQQAPQQQQQQQQQSWGQQGQQRQQQPQQQQAAQQQQSWGQQQGQYQQQRGQQSQQQQSWGQQQPAQQQNVWQREQDQQSKMQEARKQQEMHRQKQMEEMQRKQQEMKAKQDAERKLKEEQFKKQQEAIKAQRDALLKKKEEEMAKKNAEMQAKREAEQKVLNERKAAISVRRVIQKVRMAMSTNFEELKAEYQQVLETEGEILGSMKETIEEEYNKAAEQTQTRIEKAEEQKRKAEEAKAAAEKKKQEQEATAKELSEKFVALIEKAEEQHEKLKEVVKPLEDCKLGKDEVTKIASDAEDQVKECSNILKECNEMVAKRGLEMKGPVGMPPEHMEGLTKATKRASECKKSIEATITTMKTNKAAAMKRASAEQKTQDLEKLFSKYDKDKDKLLNQKEIAAFSKTECKYDLPQDKLKAIWQQLVEAEGSKGVSIDNLVLLKMSIGKERERVRDEKRKSLRLEKERVIKEKKEMVLARIKVLSGALAEADKEFVKIEDRLKPVAKRSELAKPEPEMLEYAEKLGGLVTEGEEIHRKMTKKLEELTEGVDSKFEADMRSFLSQELRPLECRMGRLDARVKRTRTLTSNFRAKAHRKTAAEFRKLQTEALKLMRYNQALKKLNSEELFTSIDTKGDGVIDEEEFLTFFENAETEIKDILMEAPKAEEKTKEKAEEKTEEKAEEKAEETAEEKAEETAEETAEEKTEEKAEEATEEKPDEKAEEDAEMKSEEKEEEAAEEKAEEKAEEATEKKAEEKKEEKKEAADAKADEKKEEEEKEPVEKVELPTDGLSKLFAYFDEAGEGQISKDIFMRMLRKHMKVVSSTILSTECIVKDSKSVRRLDLNEIVEIIEGPIKDAAMKVSRVKAKALKDGAEGWVSIVSNFGSTFLVDGGHLYKVVKEVDLTSSFELEEKSEAKKEEEGEEKKEEESEEKKEVLKPGTILEMHEAPKKDEKSGHMRLKCRVRGGGPIGWVTVSGSSGTFVQML